GEWLKTADYRRVVVASRTARLGAGHWKTVDARLDLEVALAQVRRTPAQRKAVERAWGLSAQGSALSFKGHAAKAIPLARQGPAIGREELGEKHADYAHCLNTLAGLHKSMGDHRSALPLYKQAVEVYKTALGEKHPHYATCLNNLAGLYHARGEHKA